MTDTTAPRLDRSRAEAWQDSWDRQQAAYMPDREERFTAMLDVVEAQCGRAPRVLDLAGGTGSITRRLLTRMPDANSVVVDLDPALLTIARATFEHDHRAAVVRADLADPGWTSAVGPELFDAVLTATALHWIPEPALVPLYQQVHELLVPGGVFCNADHMVDDRLVTLTPRLQDHRDGAREALYASGDVLSWDDWWEVVRRDPVLGEPAKRRDELFAGDHDESTLSLQRQRDLLLAAGFGEVGEAWRGLTDAVVVAVR